MSTIAVRAAIAGFLSLFLVGCPPTGGSVVSVSIDGGDRRLTVGTTRTLTATVVTAGGASRGVTWTSSDEAIASIDASGTIVAVAVGSVTIAATSVADPSLSDDVRVIIEPPSSVRWTDQFGTEAHDIGRAVAIGPAGSVFVAGDTLGSLDWNSYGGWDVFLRAYDVDGNVLWSRQFGTSDDDHGRGVATDTDGNVYVVGDTEGALAAPDVSRADAFVRSYDADGVERWTRQFGTSGEDVARGVATDAGGNVYVVGEVGGDLAGDGGGGASTAADAFVRAYDGDGDERWTRQFGTSANDIATGVAVGGDSVVVAGYTGGSLDGSGAGGFDAFVRVLDRDGAHRWTRQFGSTGDDYVMAVAVDASGNVFVGGYTNGDLDAPVAGTWDAFVRSYDPDGSLRWAHQFGTGDVDMVLGVSVDARGDVFVVGETGGDLDGPGIGITDAFLRVYDHDGHHRWTHQFGTVVVDVAYAVAAVGSGDVAVAGMTGGDLEGSALGGWDAFVRRYEP